MFRDFMNYKWIGCLISIVMIVNQLIGASICIETYQTDKIKLVYPNGLAVDEEGNLYISDIGTNQIYKMSGNLQLMLVAGTGDGGFSGDGGPALKAQLNAPFDLAFDKDGNLLVADTYNHRIRRIDRDGIITTIAGNGNPEYRGDKNGPVPALEASLNNPQGIAIDGTGNILIADTFNNQIKRVDKSGMIATIAGTVPGFGGDDGPAVNAQLSLPMAVAVAPDGTIYFSDAGNSRIRRISLDGKIKTAVGFGPGEGVYGAGFVGDGRPAEKARIFSATDIKFDTDGNFYISDSGNNRIRVIRGGIINTLAGVGSAGFNGDTGKASEAELNTPQKIALGPDDIIYIADRSNHRIRRVDDRGIIDTIAGEGRPDGMIIGSRK